jgi:hypothetical protein
MIEYSHQNSLTFGYGGGILNDKTPGAELKYHFSPCAREALSFKDECRRTADVVLDEAERIGRPVYLLLSGGLDSVAMAKGFKATGRPFKTITYAFNGKQNEHELEHVRDLVLMDELDHSYFWMDGVKWMKSDEAHEWFHRTNCWELGTLPLMKLMQHVWFELGGTPVFGGGDMDVIREDGQWFYSRFESFLSRYWFSERFGLGSFVSFFQHTPEITLSILSEPELLRAGSGQDPMANKVLNELKIVKYNVMHRTWPGLRRRLKFGGTELIVQHITQTEEAWRRERELRFDETWKMPFQAFRDSISARHPSRSTQTALHAQGPAVLASLYHQ